MRWRKTHIPTLRQAPNDAEVPSHKYLVQAGYIRQLAAGIYCLLPLAKRSLLKIENIIREEMNAIGAQEFELPALLPAEQWKKSGRWDLMGPNMFRLKDRKQGDYCLGMTHEEIFAFLAWADVRSYKELPQIWYQIQTKFRDEPRPKAGLLRVRQFSMKDSYSLDVDSAGLDQSFNQHRSAYEKIYARCQLPIMVVDADTGSMGGSASSEFMVETNAGEDLLAKCSKCSYAANVEKATSKPAPTAAGSARELEQFATPGVKTIEALTTFKGGAPANGQIKTLVMKARDADKSIRTIVVLLRGDHQLSDVKFANYVKALEVFPADESEIVALMGAHPGSLGAVQFKGKAQVIADTALKGAEGMVTGANKDGFHYRGVSIARDVSVGEWADVRTVSEGEGCPLCGAPLRLAKCLEVGHIFKLGTKYSVAMEALVLDRDGKRVPIVMGSYGIGVGRILAGAAEVYNDEFGMKLPPTIAPFDVVICPLGGEKIQELGTAAENLYNTLSASGWDVLLDDRDERPGVKFKDADLIGIPIRVVFGEKSFAEKKVEVVCRWTGEKQVVPLDGIQNYLTELRARISAPLKR
jgi:prolyl-tRNA synthetase